MTNIWRELVHTASEIYEPDNGWGLAGLLIIGLPSTITAVFSGVFIWRQRKHGDKLDRVEANTVATVAQVVNNHGHKPVLRADIDTLGVKLDAVLGTLTDHGTRLNGIETYLRGR